MKVSVIGGGHGCYAAAVDLTEKGHEVTLWRRDKDLLKSLQDTKTISVLDAKGEREVEPASITDDIEAAIKQASVIVIPLPATTHETLAVLTAKLWQDGQVVFLPPGTFGSYRDLVNIFSHDPVVISFTKLHEMRVTRLM